MSKNKIVWLCLSAIYVKALWVLHPGVLFGNGSTPEYQMFPLAPHVLISKPTYFFFLCEKSMWLIITWSWLQLMPEYKKPLSALFIIQALQFVEYFFTYNEPMLWVNIGTHRLDIDLSLAKLTIPTCILVYQQVWKEN